MDIAIVIIDALLSFAAVCAHVPGHHARQRVDGFDRCGRSLLRHRRHDFVPHRHSAALDCLHHGKHGNTANYHGNRMVLEKIIDS